MLLKLFGTRTRKQHAPSKPTKPMTVNAPAEERPWSALKIIHAGGKVESYYMAIPAKRIIEKYPLFTLARPEIFKQPWDSIVRPEEILVPGQKFFVVPNQTVRKLKQRIRKPVGENLTMDCSFVSDLSADASVDDVSQVQNGFSRSCSISCIGSGITTKGKSSKARVRFIGVDSKHDAGSGSLEKKGRTKKEVKVAEPVQRRRKERSLVIWQPSLTAIHESHSSDECCRL